MTNRELFNIKRAVKNWRKLSLDTRRFIVREVGKGRELNAVLCEVRTKQIELFGKQEIGL